MHTHIALQPFGRLHHAIDLSCWDTVFWKCWVYCCSHGSLLPKHLTSNQTPICSLTHEPWVLSTEKIHMLRELVAFVWCKVQRSKLGLKKKHHKKCSKELLIINMWNAEPSYFINDENVVFGWSMTTVLIIPGLFDKKMLGHCGRTVWQPLQRYSSRKYLWWKSLWWSCSH